MDRLIRAAQRWAIALLVCAVAFSAARASVGTHGSFVPALIALGVAGYVIWQGSRLVRRLLPKRTPTAVRPPTLPARAHWLSPRSLRRRGQP
jgi:hypothetical protein